MNALSGINILDCSGAGGALYARELAGLGAAVTPVTVDVLAEAVRRADVLVESLPPGRLEGLGLGYGVLAGINPALIMVSVTPYGQSGPYQDYPASDLTLQAMAGWLSVTGTPEAPLPIWGSQAYHAASLYAANAVLLALMRRRETGRGQHIDISVLECAAACLDHVLVRYFYQGIVAGRRGGRHWNNSFDVFRTGDGYVLLSLHQDWDTLAELLAAEGMAEDLTEAKWRDRAFRDSHIDHIVDVVGRWALQHKAAELEAWGQLMHFPWAAVRPAV